MVAYRSGSELIHRWSVRLTLLAVIVALITGWILWYSIAASSITEVQRRVDIMHPILTGIRLTLITVLAICWPLLTRNFYRGTHRTPDEVARLHSLRWRIVIWLIVIELVLGQNLLGQFFAMMHQDLL